MRRFVVYWTAELEGLEQGLNDAEAKWGHLNLTVVSVTATAESSDYRPGYAYVLSYEVEDEGDQR